MTDAAAPTHSEPRSNHPPFGRRLERRTAVITGGASGIGLATARRLGLEGATVLITDIDEDALERSASRLKVEGLSIYTAHHDVTDPGHWDDVTQFASTDLGGLDILVNNAGIGKALSLEETSAKDWDLIVAVNQTAVFLGLRAAASLLRRSQHAAVVNVSSIFGSSGGFGSSAAYHAAKGAVRTLTKNAAIHWAADGIRVNSVHPGFIDTPILDARRQTGGLQPLLEATPMKRLGRPEDVAAGIAYLAGDDAGFVTGAELYIDGGFMAR